MNPYATILTGIIHYATQLQRNANSGDRAMADGSAAAVEIPAVQINLGLSTKQIATFFAGLAGVIVAAMGSGWLFIPAKEADLAALRSIVQEIRSDQLTNKANVGALTTAISDLSRTVAELKAEPPKRYIIERPVTKSRNAQKRPQ